jgi:hypothetical protein
MSLNKQESITPIAALTCIFADNRAPAAQGVKN